MAPRTARKSSPQPPTHERELVAVFPSVESLEQAISALASHGWDRAEMSLLGHKNLIAEPRGQGKSTPEFDREPVVSDVDVRQGRTLAAGIAGVVAAFIASGATIMTGGTALAAVIGAAAAGGGVTVAVDAIGQILGEKRGEFLESQIERGGIVLWLSMGVHHDEALATDILRKHGAVDVHARDVNG